MIKPENYETDAWKTIKAKNITTSPTLIHYLRQTKWNVKDGHPKQLPTCEKFQRLLQKDPYGVFYKFNEATQQLKLLTPSIKPTVWEIIILRFPKPLMKMYAPDTPRLRPIIKGSADPKAKSDCSGSMKNYASSDEILTEFEIEETPAMVKKWIKNKWIIPAKTRAIILLDSSSDSDTSETDKLLARRLQYLLPTNQVRPDRPWNRPSPGRSSQQQAPENHRFQQERIRAGLDDFHEGVAEYVPAFGGTGLGHTPESERLRQQHIQAGIDQYNHMYYAPDDPDNEPIQWLNHEEPCDFDDEPVGEPHPDYPPPPNMNRPVPRQVGKFDLFCDDSTDKSSDNS